MLQAQNGLRYAIALVWLWSGIQPLCFANHQALDLLQQIGIKQMAIQWFLLISSSLLDVILGLLCLTKWHKSTVFWRLQIILVLGYSAIIGILLPQMWQHPFAPLIKNLPILAILYFLFQLNQEQSS